MDGSGLSIFDINGLYISLGENRYCETSWEWGELPINIVIKEKIESAKKEKAQAPKTPEEEKTEMPGTPEKTETEVPKAPGMPKEPKLREMSEKAEMPEEVEKETVTEAPEMLKEPKSPEIFEPSQIRGPEPVRSREPSQISKPESAQNVEREPEEELPLRKVQARAMANRAPAAQIPVQDPLYADKWKQLCSQYPVCHPFEDGEDYITIAPKDFVILRKEYQNLVSNSFLLHSFYNYHHVILGKAGKENNDIYYIGVPGNYLDREKRVAVMFGFEGFAISSRGNRGRNPQQRRMPVETGAFGYYMRKVEI